MQREKNNNIDANKDMKTRSEQRIRPFFIARYLLSVCTEN